MVFTQEELDRADYLNKVIFKQDAIARKHDMSPDGCMTMFVDESGDMILELWDDQRTKSIAVEFCHPGTGGGGSPRTFRALRELFVAMTEDQADNRYQGRAGRYPVNPESHVYKKRVR